MKSEPLMERLELEKKSSFFEKIMSGIIEVGTVQRADLTSWFRDMENEHKELKAYCRQLETENDLLLLGFVVVATDCIFYCSPQHTNAH